jgi:hypothetical protein
MWPTNEVISKTLTEKVSTNLRIITIILMEYYLENMTVKYLCHSGAAEN